MAAEPPGDQGATTPPAAAASEPSAEKVEKTPAATTTAVAGTPPTTTAAPVPPISTVSASTPTSASVVSASPAPTPPTASTAVPTNTAATPPSATSGGGQKPAPIENEFERAKAAFEQNGDSFRSLNQLMWQVPLIAMTLTGGLWYAVFNTTAPRIARLGLLLLAAIADAALGALVLPRVRNVMEAHLLKMKEFYEPGFAKPKDFARFTYFGRSRGAMNVYRALLLVAAAMSAIAFALVIANRMEPANAGASQSTTTTTTTTTDLRTGITTTTTVTTTGPVVVGTHDAGVVDATTVTSTPVVVGTRDAGVDAANVPSADAPLSDGPPTINAWSQPLDGATATAIDATLPSPQPVNP